MYTIAQLFPTLSSSSGKTKTRGGIEDYSPSPTIANPADPVLEWKMRPVRRFASSVTSCVTLPEELADGFPDLGYSDDSSLSSSEISSVYSGLMFAGPHIRDSSLGSTERCSTVHAWKKREHGYVALLQDKGDNPPRAPGRKVSKGFADGENHTAKMDVKLHVPSRKASMEMGSLAKDDVYNTSNLKDAPPRAAHRKRSKGPNDSSAAVIEPRVPFRKASVLLGFGIEASSLPEAVRVITPGA